MKEIVVDETFIRRMEQYRVPNRDLGMIGACSISVVVFAEKMLGIRLYAWQVYVLKDMQEAIFHRKRKYVDAYYTNDGNRDADIDLPEFSIICSRQIGKSLLDAILGFWVALFNHAPCDRGRNSVVGIASISDEQAKKLLSSIKKLIIIGDSFMRTQYTTEDGKPQFGKEFFSDLLDTNGNSADTITFKPYNARVHKKYILKDSVLGSTLNSYPPTAKVLGNTYSLTIQDECGKTDKMTDEFHEDYMYPTGNAHQAVRLYNSTGWVTSGFFYRMIDPDDIFAPIPGLKKYMFTIDAVRIEDPTYHSTIMKKIRQKNADGKTAEVQRGYYCRFPKGDKNFFDSEDIHAMFQDYSMYEEYKGECDLGIDFGGQTKSQTVLTISKYDEKTEKIMRLWHKEYEVGKDDTIVDDIKDAMRYFNIQRIITEDIPQADYKIREMRDQGWEVYAMSPRAEKVKKYTAFRTKLHRGDIASYEDEPLRTEMLALESGSGSKQSTIQHAPGYSDDRIDSFKLSTYFFLGEENSFSFYRF